MPITMIQLDQATKSATAFATWNELKSAMADGYIPSLYRKNAAAARLGELLEYHGLPVFWIA